MIHVLSGDFKITTDKRWFQHLNKDNRTSLALVLNIGNLYYPILVESITFSNKYYQLAFLIFYI